MEISDAGFAEVVHGQRTTGQKCNHDRAFRCFCWHRALGRRFVGRLLLSGLAADGLWCLETRTPFHSPELAAVAVHGLLGQ